MTAFARTPAPVDRAGHPPRTRPDRFAPSGETARLLLLQRSAGNRATAALLADRPSRWGSAPEPRSLQRCPGGACGDGCVDTEAGTEEQAPPVQRSVDAAMGQAIDAGRFPGTPAAHPPLLNVVEVFDRLPEGDKRDTVRALNPGQQLAWVRYCLDRRDDTTWHVIIQTVSTQARTYAVRSLMAAKRMNEPRGPWGAYGVINGLSDTDQLAVLNQLVEQERRILQQGLASAPIDRPRLERQLAAVDPESVPAVRRVDFPVVWVADELPQRTLTAGGPASYMGSQGAHSVAQTNAASGMRMVGTRYWRAFIPEARAVELQRILNELPRDLDPWLATHLKGTPPGQDPKFPWVSQQVGQMDRPFTVAELQSIPSLVRKFNANRNSLTPAEAQLMSRTVSLHVGGAHQGGSPWSSWSVPPEKGKPEPVTWSGDRRFRVKADFQKSAVLDNTKASAANTLAPADANFEAGLNPDEAEYLATAESKARVLTVQPLSGAVKGELVAGSTAWMARNATQLRWAGRGMIVVSFAISGYRIATADEAGRARVVGEEAGAQLFGIGGAVLAGAACVGLGIATGGVGLLLCGMAGGLLGGMAGSAIGGATADQLGKQQAQNDPFGLTTGNGQMATAQPATPAPQEDWAVLTAPPEILVY
ncbi:hypothetical protein E4P39_03675 [Blastococcus sp. CT_GayMR19]|uniref:hypothetical protein n=1 Tax=Blastococcus sp. CT_GayMR19 TaxID=2559608 RepID=UPI0010731830|nr:hypothetical protein [Blastococcus sp. CT_GayMR19]TFV78331.1 hypothetical protein E4P39_03675 [Blastococcus sp. CT_GayMR19]